MILSPPKRHQILNLQRPTSWPAISIPANNYAFASFVNNSVSFGISRGNRRSKISTFAINITDWAKDYNSNSVFDSSLFSLFATDPDGDREARIIFREYIPPDKIPAGLTSDDGFGLILTNTIISQSVIKASSYNQTGLNLLRTGFTIDLQNKENDFYILVQFFNYSSRAALLNYMTLTFSMYDP